MKMKTVSNGTMVWFASVISCIGLWLLILLFSVSCMDVKGDNSHGIENKIEARTGNEKSDIQEVD